ncbi:enoyl-CoA hydratase, partial [Cycloclasticus sp. 44_32_T64]
MELVDNTDELIEEDKSVTTDVISEVKDGIAIWRMNRVDTRNAISDGNMINDLVSLAEQA